MSQPTPLAMNFAELYQQSPVEKEVFKDYLATDKDRTERGDNDLLAVYPQIKGLQGLPASVSVVRAPASFYSVQIDDENPPFTLSTGSGIQLGILAHALALGIQSGAVHVVKQQNVTRVSMIYDKDEQNGDGQRARVYRSNVVKDLFFVEAMGGKNSIGKPIEPFLLSIRSEEELPLKLADEISDGGLGIDWHI